MDGFLLANNNNKITKLRTEYSVIKLDKELKPGINYEWTIKIDYIVNSHWFVVGVANADAKNYSSIWGISSLNQVYPEDGSTDASGDWQIGDLIHVSFKNSFVTITNQVTMRSHTIPVNITGTLYPTFDVYTNDISISLVDFKTN